MAPHLPVDSFTEDLSRVSLELRRGKGNSAAITERKSKKKMETVAKSRKSRALSKQRGAARDFKADQWEGCAEEGCTQSVEPTPELEVPELDVPEPAPPPAAVPEQASGTDAPAASSHDTTPSGSQHHAPPPPPPGRNPWAVEECKSEWLFVDTEPDQDVMEAESTGHPAVEESASAAGACGPLDCGPLDYCAAPLEEFVVQKNRQREEKWQLL